MYKIALLTFAALLLVLASVLHSYMGERYLFGPLFEISDLPLFRRDRQYTERVIRFAWHITGVSWLGLASILLLAAFDLTLLIVPATGGIFAVHGVLIVATCGRRHPAWSLFLLTAALIFASTLV